MNNKLKKELKQAIQDKLAALGKDAAWLQFAKKNKYGYRLLVHKERQWKILEEIAKKVHQHFPELTEGRIVDVLAELVNHR